MKPGTFATRYPLGSGPELHGEILAPDDPRVWAGTDYASLSPPERGEKVGHMLEFGEAPVFYASGKGMSWEKLALLYPLKRGGPTR